MLFGGLKEKGIMDLESAPDDCCLRFGRTTGTESGKGGVTVLHGGQTGRYNCCLRST